MKDMADLQTAIAVCMYTTARYPADSNGASARNVLLDDLDRLHREDKAALDRIHDQDATEPMAERVEARKATLAKINEFEESEPLIARFRYWMKHLEKRGG